MTDVGFVVAAYVVVFAALAIYVVTIWRRTARARAASLRIRRDAEGVVPVPAVGDTPDVPDEGSRAT